MKRQLSSDRGHEVPVRSETSQRARRRSDRESGQALTEFAIILFPLLLLVAGIIQFGIGLNFWLDMQRIANQGARWAVVNQWPGCPRNEPVPLTGANCTGSNTLQAYLTDEALSQGLENSVSVTVCYPDDGDATTQPGDVGTPVRVELEESFTFVPIVELGTITLRADTTMRLEQEPTHLTGVGAC
jgi:hypothetical protein